MGASAAHTWECGSWIWDEADSTARGRVSLVPNPRATFPGVGCGGAHHHRSLLANPMSLGLAQARPFRVTESTPQLGHVDAVSSAVTTCTTGLRTHPTPLA